jgi:hypothetical protein
MLKTTLSRLTVIGGCILLIVGMMISCSQSSQKNEQNNQKTHNGVTLNEVLQPFGPNGLEKHLYDKGFERFYTQLQIEIKNTQNSKTRAYKSSLKFWGGDVILQDNNDGMFFFRVNREPRSLELNVHNLNTKEDIKNTLRVALINEAVNMVFFDDSPFTIQKHIQEEMLSDLAMSMCPDSSNHGWFQIVAGRLMPIVELQQFKELDDITLANQMGIEPIGYIKLIRFYANELVRSINQPAEELVRIEKGIISISSIQCQNNEQCLHESIISFWQSQFTPNKLQKFKSGCQKKYQEELKKYW